MSSFSSGNSFGLCHHGNKRLTRRSSGYTPLYDKMPRRKKSVRQDPVMVLTYIVFLGVFVSSVSSFGL